MAINTAKNWLQSKTVRVNGAIILASAAIAAAKIFDIDLGSGASEVDTDVVLVGAVGAVVNFVLRFLTTQPITTQ